MANTFISKNIAMISISTFLFISPCMVFAPGAFSKLQLPAMTIGPETVAFNLTGGLYTGVAFGKILNYQGPEKGFVTFAYSSYNSTNAVCDNATNAELGPICGRPVGLKFNDATNELYVTDAYYGLLVVNGTEGGVATQLATSADGEPFRFLDAVDIDQSTGVVYFVDASAVYTISQITAAVAANDATGRLMKYDPVTGQVTVLLRNLSGAAGVVVSDDNSYLLVTELIGKRIRKYWLKGPRANTSQILRYFVGSPDNVQKTARGDFWVTVNVQLVTNVPTGQRINDRGIVLQTLIFSDQYNSTVISEVHECGGVIYVGSLNVNYVGVYTI